MNLTLEQYQQLYQLQRLILHAASPAELSFIICNTAKTLLKFTQAIMWRQTLRGPVIQAVSATTQLNHDAPMLIGLRRLIRAYCKHSPRAGVMKLDPQLLSKQIADEWQQWLSPYVLWCPFVDPKQCVHGGLLLVFQKDCTPATIHLADQITSLIGKVVETSQQERQSYLHRLQPRKKMWLTAFVIGIMGVLLLPVHQTVLAPAEISAKDPFVVTSPLNGVVQHFDVLPNQHVVKNQLLFSLDSRELAAQVTVAQKTMQQVAEKLRKANYHSFTHADSKAQLAILKIELAKAKAEYQYNAALLLRTHIQSPQAGIVLYTDQDDWLGKPVKLGEKIMVVANPQHKQLQINLPVADAIELNLQSPVNLYLTATPLHVIKARLSTISYSANIDEVNGLSYRLTAQFLPGQKLPRIGLRGVAKLYGQRVTLFYYLMRRPITALRRMFSL